MTIYRKTCTSKHMTNKIKPTRKSNASVERDQNKKTRESKTE